MTILDFIQNVLIDEVMTLQREGKHDILSLSLVYQGIEFLGACLDSESFSAKGLSAARFRRAIYDLFPASYYPFNQGSGTSFDLYENLQGTLWHAILPASRLVFIRRSEKEKCHANHLEVKEIRGMNRLVIVLEDLFRDYENACREITARIRQGRLKGWKFAKDG